MPAGGSSQRTTYDLVLAQAPSASASDALFDFRALWHEIVEARLRVAYMFARSTRSFLLLARCAPAGKPLSQRSRSILERILLGEGQKLASIELDLSPSTIAFTARTALRAIGVSTSPTKASPLLCMLVRANRDQVTPTGAQSSLCNVGDASYVMLSVELGRSALLDQLSPAERSVILMRIEGLSLSTIAERRKTSQRTVANQLSAAFRTLGVSGRSSLIHRLALVGQTAGAEAGHRNPSSPAARSRAQV